MSVLCFQLDQIPDLSLHKYQSMADTGIGGVLKRHENFLRQWHGICSESASSFHLLYYFLPSAPIGHRLKAYFLIQGNKQSLQLMEPLLGKSPLSDFFTLNKSTLPDVRFSAGATMTKKERVADIYNPLTGQNKTVHYVPKWETNEEARLYDLFRIMQTVSQAYSPQEACAFRVDLYPASAALETRKKLNPILQDLRGDNDIKLVRDTGSMNSDNYARGICKEYEDWITSIETTPHFRANIYAFADNTFKAKVLLNAAGAEALSEGDFAIAPIRPDADGLFTLFSRMGQQPADYCRYAQEATAKGWDTSWSTTFCLPEVVPFFRLPTLYDGETIEISKETAPAQVSDGIYLGEDTNGYPVNFPLEDLPRHAFFTGMPGAGKTNTMLHLITQLRKKGIPFLAMEPAKKEYRALLGHPEMRDIHLFSPHLQSKFPLQMNPLEFPLGVRLSEHINALLDVFQGTFLLEGPIYKFLGSAIEKSYTDLGWDIEDENTAQTELLYPTLQDVYDNLEKEIKRTTYDAERQGNMQAFLQVRLGSLMERDAGQLFNVPVSTVQPDDWLNVSAIVELEVLGEQAKNFFVLMICHYILESLRADPNGGTDSNGKKLPVRHVLFIEEAHNIIAPDTQQASADTVDPKISATEYIVKMLAEVRALREAIVIADQLPTSLASQVTKNTGLKLVHRLTAQDDREQIGTAISASPLQLERMASFTKGRAFIYHEKTQKPFEMQVAEWKAPALSFDVSNDAQLYEMLYNEEQYILATMTALGNWNETYVIPLDKRAESLKEQMENASDRVELACCKSRSVLLANEYRQLIPKLHRLQALWLPDAAADHPLHEEFAQLLEYVESKIESLS